MGFLTALFGCIDAMQQVCHAPSAVHILGLSLAIDDPIAQQTCSLAHVRCHEIHAEEISDDMISSSGLIPAKLPSTLSNLTALLFTPVIVDDSALLVS